MKKLTKRNVLMLLALNLFALTTLLAQQKDKNSKRESMITLIANPEKFDGRWVSTRGFLKFVEGEQIRIYFSKDDLRYNNMKNSFVLTFNEKKFKTQDFSKMNGHFVSIIGWFRDIKHYYYGGAIEDITYIESSDDEEFIKNYKMELEERRKIDSLYNKQRG